jgi:hypothetical protein
MAFTFPDPSASPWTAPNGQIFIYNSQTGNWEHEYIGGGTDDTLESVTYRDEFTDVNISVGPTIHMSPDHELEARGSSEADWEAWDQYPCPLNTGGRHSMAFGNGRFVMVANGTSKAWVSVDGSNWATSDTEVEPNNGNQGIMFANGKFIVKPAVYLDINSPRYLWSTDGESWTGATISGGLDSDRRSWPVPAYGKGIYTSPQQDGTTLTSTDGENWTINYDTLMPGSHHFMFTAFGNDMFVAAGLFNQNPMNDGVSLVYSIDGVNWINSDAMRMSIDGLSFENGVFIARVFNGYYTSSDGISWDRVETAVPLQGYYHFNIAGGLTIHSNNKTSNNNMVVSSDLTNWDYHQHPGYPPEVFAYGNGLLVGYAPRNEKRFSVLKLGSAEKGLFYDNEPVALQSSLTTINDQIEQNKTDLSGKLPLNFTLLSDA